ncbi:MAG TPA: phosphoglucomutase/phosphomannomutase family protein, partial [Anaerolineaceae bacterium]|nr:phosphoglucomutase/phosphomannomutase family protein [Anaerolineaceae bacterium]
VGPVFYDRIDQRLKYPVAKDKMVAILVNDPPASIGGEELSEVSTLDGVKYIFKNDSWLLIRPSGTEPVLRIYAEGRSEQLLKELLDYGKSIADKVQ